MKGNPVEAKETKEKKQSFLDKEVIYSVEDFHRMVFYCQRPDVKPENKICTVSPDIYDLITLGDVKAPSIWYQGVHVYNSDTKDQVLKAEARRTEMVIIR